MLLLRIVRNAIKGIFRFFGLDIIRSSNAQILEKSVLTSKSPGQSQEASFASLRNKFPHPDIDPQIKSLDWALDGGGRELVFSLIEKHQIRHVLEIGAFLGGSVMQWLNCAKELKVVCVDLWSKPRGDMAEEWGFPEYKEQLNAPEGFYQTFLANMKNYQDRVVPVRGKSPHILVDLYLEGYSPDLIYIDSNKSIDDLKICGQLWPESILTGDDWNFEENGRYPMRENVELFCQENDFEVIHEAATWVLVPANNPK